jgi:NAD(P)-dependent dehydrogenase (short-subunit alcohol dehydrogenase family)
MVGTIMKILRIFIIVSLVAALNSSMVALAQDLKIKGITVIMLHPGRVATAMTKFEGIRPEDSASKIINFIHDTTIL